LPGVSEAQAKPEPAEPALRLSKGEIPSAAEESPSAFTLPASSSKVNQATRLPAPAIAQTAGQQFIA